MSGGSYNYFFRRCEDISEELKSDFPNNKKVLKIADILETLSPPLHDIEWVNDGDKCPGDEDKEIDEAFKVIINIIRRD